MIYGYARVSDKDQNLDTQLDQLNRAGVDEIVQEKVIGVAKKKNVLDALIERMMPGDTLVVTRMDRFGRNALQMLQLVEEFQERDINFVVLDLNIDTRTPTGKFILTVMAGFSELDRAYIKEKQRNGVELAKQAGKYAGRVKKYTEAHDGLSEAIAMYKRGDTVKYICSVTKIGRSSLYRELAARGIER